MPKARKKRVLTPTRFKHVRVDASVKTTVRTIEQVMGLPEGSVQINLPTQKKARGDRKIRTLLRDWGYVV